jgi:hypothetical protein
MNSSNEIVPWVCHICGGEFDTPHGGICGRCHGATCFSHLYHIGKKLKVESQWICDHCLTEEEKTEKKNLNRFTLQLPNKALKRDAAKKRRAP